MIPSWYESVSEFTKTSLSKCGRPTFSRKKKLVGVVLMGLDFYYFSVITQNTFLFSLNSSVRNSIGSEVSSPVVEHPTISDVSFIYD